MQPERPPGCAFKPRGRCVLRLAVSEATVDGESHAGRTSVAPSEAKTESVYAWSLEDAKQPTKEGAWRGRLLRAILVILLCLTTAATVVERGHRSRAV